MAKRQLTKDQRDWILERDGYQCVFHTWMNGSGLIRCPNEVKLEVHHIKPHRYLAQFYPVIVELPTNLIVLCRIHHHFVHPDMVEALKEYKRNKGSFNEAFAQREFMMSRGIKYWNDHWDQFFKYWAMESTLHFVKKKEWII